jgi:trimeric autotransporter adhesin
MSKIKLQGNASGTGTTTFQSANTSSNTTFTLPGTDGTNGQVLTTDGAGALTFTTVSGGGGTTTNALTMNSGGAGDASGTTFNGSTARTISYNTIGAAATGAANTFTAAQTFRAANAVRSEAASTQDAIVLAGRAGGTSSYAVTLTPATLSASRTVTLPDGGGNYTLGYLNVPQSGSDKTTSYSLATTDVGKFVGVGTSGSITIPDATFAAGDVISLFNNTTGNITITCTITTAYIAGTDADKATMTLATRGVATILFISGTVCVVSGNVS